MKISVFFLVIINAMFSQGAWDMHFVKISTDMSYYIGKEFFVDLKNEKNDIFVEGALNHEIMNTSDSVVCILRNRKVLIKEDWTWYIDHGVVSEQAYKVLEGEYRNQTIKKIRLKSIDSTTIKLQGEIESIIVFFNIKFSDAKGAVVSLEDFLHLHQKHE